MALVARSPPLALEGFSTCPNAPLERQSPRPHGKNTGCEGRGGSRHGRQGAVTVGGEAAEHVHTYTCPRPHPPPPSQTNSHLLCSVPTPPNFKPTRTLRRSKGASIRHLQRHGTTLERKYWRLSPLRETAGVQGREQSAREPVVPAKHRAPGWRRRWGGGAGRGERASSHPDHLLAQRR